MSELYNKSIGKLELSQVLKLLADCAGSRDGKEACLQLYPVSDLEDVRALLAQTQAAVDLSNQKGYPAFSGVTNITASVDRANQGGTCSRKNCSLSQRFCVRPMK